MEDSRVQRAKSSLEETMPELRRSQADSSMVEPENEISMADMDYSKVGLPWFHVQNDMSQPPQEEMSNLEASMAKLRRVQSVTSQA